MISMLKITKFIFMVLVFSLPLTSFQVLAQPFPFPDVSPPAVLPEEISPIVPPDYSSHSHRDFHFSKPFSGNKVDHYEVQLEFPQNQLRKYLIPDDCSQAINDVSFGSPEPVNIIDRNVWFKVINDCRYVSIMSPESTEFQYDYVSDYDFYNAKLSDLPFASQCEVLENGELAPECVVQEEGKLSISTFFPFLQIRRQNGETDLEECKFTDGVFRGHLVQTVDGIQCQKDSRARGLRLISIDHIDLNYDGYEDVLLRIMPLGRGVSRLPVLLPLTRKDPGQAFIIPHGIAVDFMVGY